MNALSKLNGWKRLWLLLAAIWTVPVAVFTFTELPNETESGIKSRWASEIIDLRRKYHGQGESMAAYRQLKYGNASDEEIIHPSGHPSGKFDLSSAIPVAEAEQINQQYESKLAQLANKSPSKVVLIGFVVWLIPLVTIYVLGLAIYWVYVGFRRDPD